MKKLLQYCIWALIIAGLAAALPDPLEVKPPKLFLKLWFKTPNSGLTQLYWNSSGNFKEEESEKSTIYKQGQFISQKYMLPENYSQLRFDPFNAAGEFELKDISIVDIDDKPVRNIDTSKVNSSSQIESFKFENKVIKAKTLEKATDPSILIEDSYAFQYPSWTEKYATNIKTFFITFIVIIILGYLADISDKAAETESKPLIDTNEH